MMPILLPLLLFHFLFQTWPLKQGEPPVADPLKERKYEIGVLDGGLGKEGYQVFFPLDFQDSTSSLVVFLHGYGGYNPMYYGGWIRHLVESGRTVIFPYYQDNMISPSPAHFAKNTTIGIHKAMEHLLQTVEAPKVTGNFIHYIGHSYGGVVAASLASLADSFNLPPPGAILLTMPGTGFFSQGPLETYEGLPSSCVLGVVVGSVDNVAGDRFGRLVYQTSPFVERKLWITMENRFGSPILLGAHNIPCSRDNSFDNGVINYNFIRSILGGRTDAYDLSLWRLFDWMESIHESDQWIDENNIYCLKELGFDKKGNWYGELPIEWSCPTNEHVD